MSQRFATIWFPHLLTDYRVRCQPELRHQPFVMTLPERGRAVIKALNAKAQALGVQSQMVAADCKTMHPELQIFGYKEGLAEKLLHNLGIWCIRFTPVVAIDPPDGLILETTGCTQLWGGEANYLKDLLSRLGNFGYHVRAAIATTIGAAWAASRYGNSCSVIAQGEEAVALSSLPPTALRIEPATVERLHQLGFCQIKDLLSIPQTALQRRFGKSFIKRWGQVWGSEPEYIKSLQPSEPYEEWLPSLEPIRTATGISLALQRLLSQLCARLKEEGLGLRSCIFKTYRVDNKEQQLTIATTHASCNEKHLFKLFEHKIASIEPDLGIELFLLKATNVEKTMVVQETLWSETSAKSEIAIAELIDRMADRVGLQSIQRYLPAGHFWPEWSFVVAKNLQELPKVQWPVHLPRPLHLLSPPEPITVTAPVPDYPPLLFRYKGELHKIVKADGPERIEQEWWLQQGLYRDYYCVEDEKGHRFWLFRAGDYVHPTTPWFIHGIFA